MSQVKITLKGVAAELVIGNYLPSDKTIFTNWEDFYHYNDILHTSQLIADHISEIEIVVDDTILYKAKIPAVQFRKEKSYLPNLIQDGVYLRTECIENAVYTVETEIENFDISKLTFSTQDYEQIFKTGNEFVTKVLYDSQSYELNWHSGVSVGNICLLCGFRNGFFVPMYDAISKKYANHNLFKDKR